MRIVVLADIHGNLRALEAVQSDLRKRSPDAVVNPGDHLSGPLQAAATADLLMSENYQNIRGNHDRQLIDRSPARMGPSDRAAHAQLTERHSLWLRGLPATLTLEPGILLCHGTPDNDLEYLLEDVDEHGTRLAPVTSIGQRLQRGADPPVRTGRPRPAAGSGDPARTRGSALLVLCGHSHIPRVVSIGEGPLIVNPGSVGLQAYDDTHPVPHQMETGSPHARYAILDFEGSSWRVELAAVEYDWESAAREAAAANRLDWAHALATGYALRPDRKSSA